MKGERIHEMVVGDILAQGSIIGAEHFLRTGEADIALLHGAASVKQQRRTWRDADIAYRKEHGAGRLTVTVDAKALARRVILLDHVQESGKRGWIGCAIAHAQGRYGAIGVSRLPRKAAEKKSKRAHRAQQSLPFLQNALLMDF